MDSFPFPLKMLEQSIRSASPYIRWREENPDLVDTEDDIALSHIKKLQAVVGPDQQVLQMEAAMVLLLIKRR